MPRVSVILPTYNRASTLAVAIQSVLNQTYDDFELIIIDDGSTDNTKDIVYAFDDQRIAYIKHARNQGAATSRNTGLLAARGEFIAYQDSDDEWMPDKLAQKIKTLECANASVGAVFMLIEKVMRDGTLVYIPSRDRRIQDGNMYEQLLEINFITPQAVLMRKSCIDAIGLFDPAFNGLEDWDFFIRLSRLYDILYLPRVGVRVHVGKDSLTRDQFRRLKDREGIFNKYFEEYKTRPCLLRLQAYRIGHGFAFQGDMRSARRYLHMALKGSPKYFIAYLLSLTGSSRIYRMVARFYNKM